MAWPEWGVFVLVAYPLAQIPLAFYLARRFEIDGDVPVVTPGRVFWTGEPVEGSPPSPTAPTVARPGRCGRCGTDNDPTFTFCGSCLARL